MKKLINATRPRPLGSNLQTRSIFKNRAGRPKSALNSGGRAVPLQWRSPRAARAGPEHSPKPGSTANHRGSARRAPTKKYSGPATFTSVLPQRIPYNPGALRGREWARWEPPHRLLPHRCWPLPLIMPLIWTHLLYLLRIFWLSKENSQRGPVSNNQSQQTTRKECADINAEVHAARNETVGNLGELAASCGVPARENQKDAFSPTVSFPGHCRSDTPYRPWRNSLRAAEPVLATPRVSPK